MNNNEIKYVDLDGLSHFKAKNDIQYVSKVTGKGLSTNDYTTEEKNKLNGIEANAQVNSIQTVSVNGTQQVITNKNVNITVPTATSDLTNDSGYQTASDVSSAISSAITSAYKVQGSIAFANLPALSSSVEGYVYNITDSFTTTSNFVEGAGKEYPAGTNIVIIDVGSGTYKYDVLGSFFDLSNYVQISDLVSITNAEINALFE